MNKMLGFMCVAVLVTVCAGAQEKAAAASKPIPSAILPFAERGSTVRGYGEKVSELLFAALAEQPDLWLVDRQDIEKVLSEHELSASGMVDPAQAVKIGSVTGAKVLITGSVLDVDKDIHLIAKIIGTETTRVLGVSVGGTAKSDIGPLVKELSVKVMETLRQKSDLLVAPVEKREDRVAALKQTMGEKKRPVVAIRITERHVGQASIDPAAQTELTLFCKDTGFAVVEENGAVKADILIEGEGFSEFGLRRGNLVSVKARVEVKAVDRKTGEVLAVDREMGVEVDLTEQIAGKKGLQNAAARIAERLLPKLVK